MTNRKALILSLGIMSPDEEESNEAMYSSPYDAIESVRTMEKDATSQAYSWLVKDLRITADGLPNKFSQNDELFQVLYDAADAIEKLTGTAK